MTKKMIIEVLVLFAFSVVVISMTTMGETHTWDTMEEIDAGKYNATHWDQDGDGVALGVPDAWWKHYGNPVVSEGSTGEYDDYWADDPSLLLVDSTFYMYYSARNASAYSIALATSKDGLTYVKESAPILATGPSGSFDEDMVLEPCVIYEDGIFKMWYLGINGARFGIGYAYSSDGHSWTKHSTSAVLTVTNSGWGSSYIRDPYVIRIGGYYHMYLSGGTSSTDREIGLALGNSETKWSYHSTNPVVSKASTGVFGAEAVHEPTVVWDDPVYMMYFSGRTTSSSPYKIGTAWSYDGKVWTKETYVAVDIGASTTWDDFFVTDPDVMWHNGSLMMAYHGTDGSGGDYIGLAHLLPWVNKDAVTNPFISLGTTYDDRQMHNPCVVKNPRNGKYHLYYICKGGSDWAVAVAEADHPEGPYTRWGGNPVLSGTTGTWDADGIESVCVIFDRGVFRLWYTGYDVIQTQKKIGYAYSYSGTSFTKWSSPVLSNGTQTIDWDSYDVMSPWVVKVGNTYHMWYAGGIPNAHYAIGHATSPDGIQWTKDPENPVLDHDLLLITETDSPGNPVVIYENGLFTMYYSEPYHSVSSSLLNNVWRAVSLDGTHWTRDPLFPVMEKGNSTAWDDGGVSTPCIINEDGVYHVYYSAHNGSNWRLGYGRMKAGAGTYATAVLDASASWPVQWNSLSWDADLPTGTSIKFQIATNNGGEHWKFVGPDGTWNTYFTMNGENIYLYQTGRYMRVMAYMYSDNMTWWSPVIDSITVSYEQRPNPSPPIVSVSSPNGGEDWMKTKQYPITWTAVGNFESTPIDLYYSMNNGSSWLILAMSRQNSGIYRWTLPGVETSGALVRVVANDIDGITTFDTSDTTFAIDPPAPKSGQFLEPLSGDVLAPGTYKTSWIVHDPWGLTEAPLTLELTTDGGITWAVLADALPLSEGIEWESPTLATSSDRCQLRLSILSWLGDISVIESGEFAIDVSPPEVRMDPMDAGLKTGEEASVRAVVEDDIGLASVTLHVLGEDERTFSMEHQEDGGWTTSFLPLEEDVQVWVEASDGAHDVSSEIMDIDVSPAGSDTDRSTTLAMELGVAAFAAVLLTAIIAIIAFRRKT